MSARLRIGSEVIAAIALVVSCGSCTQGFGIEASGTGPSIQLSFVDGWVLWKGPKEACVSELRVAEEGWPTRRELRIVWRIKAASGCVRLKGATVGIMPKGFTQEINQLPLKIGRMYGATARTDEQTGGGSLPWVVCRGAPATLGWKNDYRLKDPPSSCRG